LRKVLVLTDSLALPRERPEYCNFESTWPQLVSKHFKLHQISIGGGTISDLCRQLEYHKLFDPDIIIIQSGIVDCAPRTLSLFELDVIQKIPFLGKRLLRLIQSRSSLVRKHRNIVYTKHNAFNDSIRKIKLYFPNKKIYGISILLPNRNYESKVPGITSKVNLYNTILQNSFKDDFIDIKSLPSMGVMSDYIHLNAIGHEYIYNLLKKRILNA
jgi:lysophospholipase L1-like esterase